MKNLYLLLLLCCLAGSAGAQTLYAETFDGSSNLPAGWVPSDGRVVISNQVPSSGYTTPPASGMNNVRFDHCVPTGETVALTISELISSVGKNNIRVGFGRRISAAWATAVAFEWSSDGVNWELISSDVSGGASTNWSGLSFDLPSGADNVANLRFRFSFVTATAMNCTAPPNFRIDDFTVGENFTLPAELNSFEAQRLDKQTQLRWSTASETGNAYFMVEHSADGREFTAIGRVDGAGTTRDPRQYTFIDAQPLSGINYYRLRQVNLDGRSGYSPVRSVVFGQESVFRIYPSPVSEALQLQRRGPLDTGFSWEIFDLAGRRLLEGGGEAGETGLSIPVHALPGGHFLFRLTDSRNSWAQHFVKQ